MTSTPFLASITPDRDEPILYALTQEWPVKRDALVAELAGPTTQALRVVGAA